MHIRYLSWLTISVAAAFLVVATQSFSASTGASLAFGIGAGAAVLAGPIAYSGRRHIPTVTVALATAVLSCWTVVASLVFSTTTARDLAFACALGIAGLALLGLTVNELSHDHSAELADQGPGQHESKLAAA
jgi:hypothetical protein